MPNEWRTRHGMECVSSYGSGLPTPVVPSGLSQVRRMERDEGPKARATWYDQLIHKMMCPSHCRERNG